MGVSSIPAAAAGGGGLEPKYQKFTSSGTFTLPAGYGPAKPLLVNIQVIGGGGGGGDITKGNVNSVATTQNSYFGGGGVSHTINSVNNTNVLNAYKTGCGGSGGISQTQMYLTSNLTITVGAGAAIAVVNAIQKNDYANNTPNDYQNILVVSYTAASGGTSIAGSVKAAGGNSGYSNTARVTFTSGNINSSGSATLDGYTSAVNGGGGSPSGTAGQATPLLGTIAGGAQSNSTPIFGSFGIGGLQAEGNSPSGVEGTGSGGGSIGSSGAVILTWWE